MSRAFCGTYFLREKPIEFFNELWKNLFDKGVFNYSCWQEETTKNDNRHVQLYFRPDRKYFGRDKPLMKEIKDALGEPFLHIHLEVAKGTFEANVSYCTKEETRLTGPWFLGEAPKQGDRSDIKDVKRKFDSGMGIHDIIWSASSYQSMKVAEMLNKYKKAKTRHVHVKWFYGSTGTGKTKTAIEECGDNDYWISDGAPLVFWNGYIGQKYIILDDLRPENIKFHQMLRILDRYPMTVNVKGSHVPLEAEYIWITAPCRPDHMFGGLNEDVRQLTRRIHEIREFREVEGNTNDLDLPVNMPPYPDAQELDWFDDSYIQNLNK